MDSQETQMNSEDKLIQLWQKHTKIAPEEATDFFQAGGDSLAAINLVVDLKNDLAVQISLESFMRNPTFEFLQQEISDSNVKK